MNGFGLSALTHGLRWQDAVDVSLLTLLFSWFYRLLRRTVAIQVASGIVVLLVGSWIANHLGLILTSYLLSAVSAVATIVIVVVFQHEIRRGLNRAMPSRRLSLRGGGTASLDIRATIARAVFSVAEHGKGALIVIPRRDSIFEHVTAGTMVEARLSVPVIEAIFTSASLLHDGAVVLGDDRVLRAGVVLPLATESYDSPHGTRHRAAIGLARATDALIICVSEERGSVFLAHDDVFEPMADEVELCEALRRLTDGSVRRLPTAGAANRFRLMGIVPHVVIFAGVVAAWAAMALDRSHAVARIVPLEVRGVSDGLAFDPPRYSSIAVELRSSRRELELLGRNAVEAYVDLSGSAVGFHTYPVLTRAPAGIEVASSTPASIQMLIRPRNVPGTSPLSREMTPAPDLKATDQAALRN
jgi:diadenylate cyclase